MGVMIPLQLFEYYSLELFCIAILRHDFPYNVFIL